MHRRVCALLLAAALLCVPASAHAAPAFAEETTAGGSLRPAGETTIAVVTEHLLLDLTQREGRIRASYRLRNGTDKPIDLSVAFPMPPWVLAEWKISAWLDGQHYPVRSALGPVAAFEGELELHSHWLDPFTGMAYWPPKLRQPVSPQYLIFGVSFLPGQERDLAIEYWQFPGEDYSQFLEPARRFDHLLQPARHWGGFGPLTIEVLAPDGVALSSQLPLQHRGDGRYEATFDGLPEGNLSIFLAPGRGPRWWWVQTGRMAFLAALTGLTGAAAGLFALSRRAVVRGTGGLLSLGTLVVLYVITPPHLLRRDPTGVMFLWMLFIPSLMVLHLLSRSTTRWVATLVRNRRERLGV